MLEQIQRVSDALREARITWHKRRMLAAEAVRRRHHDEFVRLLKSRSQGKVARMERERGIV